MDQISILGSGWLGLSMANHLMENGYVVKVSTTTEKKLFLLKQEGISAYLVRLYENEISGDLSSFLCDSKILILVIPPRKHHNKDGNFADKIQLMLADIANSSIEKILFISSISVYGQEEGLITEDTIPSPKTDSGTQLFLAEKRLQNTTSIKSTIVRLGGLIGYDRHPVYHLSGKKDIENPNAPINLIHKKEVIEVVFEIIKKEQWNTVFNVVAPFHPTKKTYYVKKALDFNLAIPFFKENQIIAGKEISSAKIEKVLGYQFQKELYE